ncbi:MAG: type I methionyl aminopeptidase [Elusimicrobiota bacterium]
MNRASLIEVKSAREIAKIREACRITAVVLKDLAALVRPGLVTDVLNEEAKKRIEAYAGARAAFYGYRGFPAHVCVSVNAEVVHGIPRKNKVLREGDVVSLDLGVECNGYYGDAAVSVTAGKAGAAASRLLAVTSEALAKAMSTVKAGATVGDLGAAIQGHVESHGMNVVREFVGHGIGRNLHEDPAIPNWGTPGKGARLVAGMTIAIEPMVALGAGQISIGSDGWTAKTKDGSPSAHFEHTVLVLNDGYEVLTRAN